MQPHPDPRRAPCRLHGRRLCAPERQGRGVRRPVGRRRDLHPSGAGGGERVLGPDSRDQHRCFGFFQGQVHADRARPARADEAADQMERGARPLGRHPARVPQGVRSHDHRPPGRGAHRAAVRRAERARWSAAMYGPIRRWARFLRAASAPDPFARRACGQAAEEGEKPAVHLRRRRGPFRGGSGAAGARRNPRRAGGHDDQRQGLDRRALRAARSAWSARTAARRRRARWSMPRTWWCSSAAAPAR